MRQLLQAIEDGDPSAIETLIESYGSAEALWEEARLYSGQSGEGLLHLAAYQGNIDVCIILVTQLGLDIKAKVCTALLLILSICWHSLLLTLKGENQQAI